MGWNPFGKKEPGLGHASPPPGTPAVTRHDDPVEPAVTDQAPVAPVETTGAPRSAAEIKEDVIATLKTVYDPEIPVNIYEIGLIYDIQVDPANAVDVRMTLTSPACPVAGTLPPEVENKVRSVRGVSAARVELVWDPPWTPDKMSEAAKLQLGL